MPNRNGDDRPPRDPVTHRRYAPRRNILGDPINRGGKHVTKQAANELKKAVITKRILELRIMGLSNAAISEQLVVENGTEGEMVLGIGQEQKITTTTLGADGKAVDPIRPVINLTIARRSD